MKYKPWPLIILAFFHFIEPFSKLGFYSIFFSMSPLEIISIEVTEGSARHIFEYFFLFPIAGIAIFAVKKWSLAVFLAVELWVFLSNLPYLQELYTSQQYLLFSYFIIFAILNVTVVSYFLIPAVHVAYLDPKIRWWEAKPRYSINAKCSIDGIDSIDATIRDISENGVFISCENDLELDNEINLRFKIAEASESLSIDELSIPVKVVHHFTVDKHPGYGAMFTRVSREDRRIVRKVIRALDASKAKRRPPHLTFGSLVVWVKKLLQTGEGLIPSSPNLIRKKTSN